MAKPKRLLEAIGNMIFRPLFRILSKLLEVSGMISLEGKNLIRLIPFVDKLNQLEGMVSLFGKPFYFDVLKLGHHNYLSLIETRINQDCFFLKNLTIENPVVFDVGAHIGIFSRFVLGEKDAATVYSLEPDPHTFSTLKKNLAPYGNAYPFLNGALDKKSHVELYRSNLCEWGSTINPEFAKKIGGGKEYFKVSHQVDTIDLDTFVEENNIARVDFLVINVPGEIEYLVLLGAKAMIEKFRPQVAVTVYHRNLENVTVFFKEIGNYSEIENPYKEPQSVSKIHIFSPSKK